MAFTMSMVTRSSVGRACRLSRPAQKGLAARIQPVRAVKVEKDVEEAVEVEEMFADGPDVSPSTIEVQQLLNTLVKDTEIAEMELKMGTFHLKVRRNVDSPAAAASATPAAPSPAQAAAVAAFPPVASYASIDDRPDVESVDEAMVYVVAPKVGVFRRGRYAAGKKVGKGNIANVGDQVKKGQPLGYVEQLGTFVEVKAPQAGEITAYRAEEGDPVEYNQSVVEIAPFFGGHIIGDSKYA
ncbi:hypothetical protein COO60DRAFT_1703906 [Scenedesmus sp. NREL 46B-D3]|nr:hypothetical protein COO60DRAFT_1703906 [Scenedesmus sp. NREL 46B-D3]